MYPVIVAVPGVPSDQIVAVSPRDKSIDLVLAVTAECSPLESEPGPETVSVSVPVTAPPLTAVLVSDAFLGCQTMYPDATGVAIAPADLTSAESASTGFPIIATGESWMYIKDLVATAVVSSAVTVNT